MPEFKPQKETGNNKFDLAISRQRREDRPVEGKDRLLKEEHLRIRERGNAYQGESRAEFVLSQGERKWVVLRSKSSFRTFYETKDIQNVSEISQTSQNTLFTTVT